MLGTHCIKTWSSTQDVRALSSGEAEFYALVKCAAQCLGIRSLLRDLGTDLKIHLKTDASAAIGIGMRRGLGTTRHIETSQLWIQDLVYDGRITLEKIDGKTNWADGLTKPVGQDMLGLHVTGVGLQLRRDRHELNPAMAGQT